jgi:hypothetical protein
MAKKTKMITYNVHARGRKALGQDRFFDTAALAKLVNGPAVQERVKLGDMLGYYGHWPRVAFGMATRETGLLDGKVIALPTALKTIHLSADNDGNITHQAEFLDNAWGNEAAAHYDSQSGGFSSAIDAKPGSSPSVPTDFYGFDYVLEPNYTTNRGHRAMLDAVGAGNLNQEDMLALLDAVSSDSAAMIASKNAMFDSLQHQHRMALETLERVSMENDLLIGRLAAQGSKSAMLDDLVGEGGRLAPRMAPVAPDFERFRSMPLTALQEIKSGARDDSTEARTLRRMGMGA